MLSGNAPEPELKAPNIYLHVPLNGEQNKYVNFARLAEERYGWAALNPKLARAKQALHLDSGDEMMLDGSDTESNADTAGEKAAEQGPKKRQKRSYQDIYDKADPFIDDSEMLWEEQAATSKDGFFVYSGPLVPEGQKPQIERYFLLVPRILNVYTDEQIERTGLLSAAVDAVGDLVAAQHLLAAPAPLPGNPESPRRRRRSSRRKRRNASVSRCSLRRRPASLLCRLASSTRHIVTRAGHASLYSRLCRVISSGVCHPFGRVVVQS